MSTDPVVSALRADDDSDAAQELRIAWAEEAASLGWQQRYCRTSRALERLHSRRVDALYKLARFELERLRVHGPDLELRGAKMNRLKDLWLSLVVDAARAVLPPEKVEGFRKRCEDALEGWEGRVGV